MLLTRSVKKENSYGGASIARPLTFHGDRQRFLLGLLFRTALDETVDAIYSFPQVPNNNMPLSTQPRPTIYFPRNPIQPLKFSARAVRPNRYLQSSNPVI